MLPNFLIIGAMKAGTSSIHLCLKEHPEIFMPELKEIHFFDWDLRYKKGKHFYERFFNASRNYKAIGEATPTYLSSIKAPGRIYNIIPEVKLIVSLRNPIDRCISHYRMDYQSGKTRLPLYEALNKERKYLEMGLYYKHLLRYLKYFKKEQFLYVFFDDLDKNPKKFYKSIYRFLEVNDEYIPYNLTTKATAARGERFSIISNFMNLLLRIWNYINNTKLHNYLSDDIVSILRKIYFSIVHWNSTIAEPFQIDLKTKNMLINYYRDEIKKMSLFFGKNLDNWMI